jgi:hypothetical protein
MASSGRQLLEPTGERQPARMSVPASASLQRLALEVRLALALCSTLMGQLSKYLVVQHGFSSSLALVA